MLLLLLPALLLFSPRPIAINYWILAVSRLEEYLAACEWQIFASPPVALFARGLPESGHIREAAGFAPETATSV